MRLSSRSFDHSGVLDRKYTQYGDNIQPGIGWTDVPKETVTYVLKVDDADAPGGIWNHWIVFDIPYNITDFQENQWQGKVACNSYGEQRWMGPFPANELNHQYEFKLYALDTRLDLSPAINSDGVMKAAQDHVIDVAMIVVQYFKPDSSFGGTTETPNSGMGPLGTGEMPA